MRQAAAAGAAYFALVFAAGFVLGALRSILIAPALGPLAAVLLELPLMLGLSWLACRAILRRMTVEPGLPRAAMGAVGFALLMVAEMVLGRLISGLSLRGWIDSFAQPAMLVGLAGQIAFALLPLGASGRPQ